MTEVLETSFKLQVKRENFN